MNNYQTKRITTVGMLCALAFLVVSVGRIPLVLSLKYDPKDVIIVISGFIYGPLTSFFVSFIVSFIEFMTISDDGIIGLIMNIISSCSFACTAAFIYKRKHTKYGAILGLITGCISMVIIMLLWNYLIAPLAFKCSRAVVAKLLLTAFLPFNLIKGSLNASITLLLYKPLVTALRHSNLIPQSEAVKNNRTLSVTLISCFVIITCILCILAMNGII